MRHRLYGTDESYKTDGHRERGAVMEGDFEYGLLMAGCSKCADNQLLRFHRKFMRDLNSKIVLSSFAVALLFASTGSAQAQRRGPAGPPTLGLTNGLMELESPDFNIKLVKDSQTLAALEPKGVAGYDFVPGQRRRR